MAALSLPPGTVDYQTIRDNLEAMQHTKGYPKPIVVPVDLDRTQLSRRKRNKLSKVSSGCEVILFPCGALAADGSFCGAPGLAAHLERILAQQSEAC